MLWTAYDICELWVKKKPRIVNFWISNSSEWHYTTHGACKSNEFASLIIELLTYQNNMTVHLIT